MNVQVNQTGEQDLRVAQLDELTAGARFCYGCFFCMAFDAFNHATAVDRDEGIVEILDLAFNGRVNDGAVQEHAAIVHVAAFADCARWVLRDYSQ